MSLSSSEEKILNSPAALCNMIKRIARQAGDITLDYFEEIGPGDITRKDDNSPVTQADQETEDFIQKALADILPSVPFIGEEAVSAGNAPAITPDQEYFWLVDPLDGTREFIRGGPDFTTNIALIKNGRPVIGVIYAPAIGELYAGCGEGTAVRWLEDTDHEKPITVRRPPREGLTVLSSRGMGNADKQEAFLAGFKVRKLVKRSSSIKMCAIAAGKADLFPRFGPTCEWDTAAAEAILNAAGGLITDAFGKPLLYGGREPGWYNPDFIAASFPWFEETQA
ncbi:MAG: 3'(2'),5'-bisphosphate nucleotidase CysQ [Alphaproteobacteria bacterium]|nr:3'(2'),5'-bisphosphate nucleotidase CysQ [Alphaproteobacteria bacterium]